MEIITHFVSGFQIQALLISKDNSFSCRFSMDDTNIKVRMKPGHYEPYVYLKRWKRHRIDNCRFRGEFYGLEFRPESNNITPSRAVSSAAEHRSYTPGVTSSNLVPPTIQALLNELFAASTSILSLLKSPTLIAGRNNCSVVQRQY